MAIIQLGVTVTGIRGSVGGSTYSANASGAYVKARSRGPRVVNAKTLGVRARVTGLPNYWAALTVAQKAAWNALSTGAIEEFYNSLGERVYLSGWQLFSTLLLRQMSVGQTVVSTSRTASVPTVVTGLGLTASAAGNCVVSWTGDPSQFITDYVIIFAGVSYGSAGDVSMPQSRLFFAAHTSVGLAFNFGPQLRAFFGELPVGGVLTMHVWRQQGGAGLEGWRSPVASVSAVIAA